MTSGSGRPGQCGWRRGDASLDEVAMSTGAADLHRERAERYEQDRESWRARLAQYASARNAVVAPGDGWLSLDDDQEWDAMLFGRWPILGDDFVRGPPGGEVNGITGIPIHGPRCALTATFDPAAS